MKRVMAAEELMDEADRDTLSAVTMMAVIQNPNCPKTMIGSKNKQLNHSSSSLLPHAVGY